MARFIARNKRYKCRINGEWITFITGEFLTQDNDVAEKLRRHRDNKQFFIEIPDNRPQLIIPIVSQEIKVEDSVVEEKNPLISEKSYKCKRCDFVANDVGKYREHCLHAHRDKK